MKKFSRLALKTKALIADDRGGSLRQKHNVERLKIYSQAKAREEARKRVMERIATGFARRKKPSSRNSTLQFDRSWDATKPNYLKGNFFGLF